MLISGFRVQMDFELTEEQAMVKKMASAFAQKEVKPVADRMDRQGIYPTELVQRLGEMGFMGMFLPQEFGGSGMGLLAYVLAKEEISQGWASFAGGISAPKSPFCPPFFTLRQSGPKK